MIKQDSALYRWDREIIDRLLHISEPSSTDYTDAARLFCRYRDTTHLDLVTDISRAASKWDMSMEELNAKANTIWESGWRPGGYSSVTVGSGADANDTVES